MVGVVHGVVVGGGGVVVGLVVVGGVNVDLLVVGCAVVVGTVTSLITLVTAIFDISFVGRYYVLTSQTNKCM